MPQKFLVTRFMDAVLRSLPFQLSAAFGYGRMVELPASISLEDFQAVLAEVIDENEVLRSSFHEESGRWWQEVNEQGRNAEELWQLSRAEEISAEDVSSWLEACSKNEFDLLGGKVLLASALICKNGPTWVYLSVHPVAVDSFSLDALWGRCAVLLRYRLAGQKPIYLKRLGAEELLAAQRKVAALQFAHSQYWLEDPVADLRADDAKAGIFESYRRTPAQSGQILPAICQEMELSAEIKDLLVQAAAAHSGTWEQAQLASVASYFGRLWKLQRINLGYPMSNQLLFGEAAAFSDAVSQTLTTSQVNLPLSLPVQGMGLEQMKQVKVGLDRIEDYSLVTDSEIAAAAAPYRPFDLLVRVRDMQQELVIGQEKLVLKETSQGILEGLELTVLGFEKGTEPVTYLLSGSQAVYSREELQNILGQLMGWQYQWTLSVLHRYDTDAIPYNF